MIQVGIVGGTGYTGVELLRLLAIHPKVEVKIITSRSEAGRAVADLFPSLRGHYDLVFSAPESQALLACDIIFFATPHGVAQSMMKELMQKGTRIIDLSADFRLRDIDTWEKWYGQKHACPELVAQSVYGLAEVNREYIRTAQLVACPGCYPTSIQLALKPLLSEGWVDPSTLIANSASGITGAGRQGKIDFLLAECSDSFKAYAVSGHRHLPEIEQGLRDIQPASHDPASITFVPHLLPIVRGIHSTVYAQLNDSSGDLQELYEATYKSEPFVDVLPAGTYPQTRSVKSTNMCRLSVEVPQGGRTVVIMSVIDNLAKGASAQAVQNMNIMLDMDESLGLNFPAILP